MRALAADPGERAATVVAFQRLTRVTLAAPVPVVAAIDGVCIGDALEFAAGCDLRLATDRSRFGTPEWGSGSWPPTRGRRSCRRCWARRPPASCAPSISTVSRASPHAKDLGVGQMIVRRGAATLGGLELD
jgi:enoyl-CoA hydratase/isomerase-like protein